MIVVEGHLEQRGDVVENESRGSELLSRFPQVAGAATSKERTLYLMNASSEVTIESVRCVANLCISPFDSWLVASVRELLVVIAS
jgi:hypothetical protein